MRCLCFLQYTNLFIIFLKTFYVLNFDRFMRVIVVIYFSNNIYWVISRHINVISLDWSICMSCIICASFCLYTFLQS